MLYYSPYAILLQDEQKYDRKDKPDKREVYIEYTQYSTLYCDYRRYMLNNVLDEKNKPLIKHIFLLFVVVFNKVNINRFRNPELLLTYFFPSLFDNITIKLLSGTNGVGDIINTKKIERVNFIFDIIEEKQIEFVMNTAGINYINTRQGQGIASTERSKLFSRYNTIVKYLTIVV